MPRTVHAPPQTGAKKIKGQHEQPKKMGSVLKKKRKGVKGKSPSKKRAKVQVAGVETPDKNKKQKSARKSSRRVLYLRRMKEVQKTDHKRGVKGYLPQKPLQGKIRDFMELHGSDNMRLSKRAGSLIKLSAESNLKSLVDNAKNITINAGRKKVTSADIITSLKLINPDFLENHFETLFPNETSA